LIKKVEIKNKSIFKCPCWCLSEATPMRIMVYLFAVDYIY